MNQPPDENSGVAADIARQINESNPQAIIQIERIVHHLGQEVAYAVLQEALAVEAKGGMLTEDKKRRRTAGGVFFYLVRGRTPPELRQIIWPTHRVAGEERAKPKPRPPFPGKTVGG